MKRPLRITAILSVAVIVSTGAFAQQGQGPRGGGVFMACRDDAKNFCQDVQRGGGRIKECLEDHYKEISDACYQALQNAPQRGERGGDNNEPPPSHDGPPPPDDN